MVSVVNGKSAVFPAEDYGATFRAEQSSITDSITMTTLPWKLSVSVFCRPVVPKCAQRFSRVNYGGILIVNARRANKNETVDDAFLMGDFRWSGSYLMFDFCYDSVVDD